MKGFWYSFVGLFFNFLFLCKEIVVGYPANFLVITCDIFSKLLKMLTNVGMGLLRDKNDKNGLGF